MEKITDLDRHRVMMPYAKNHKWVLWHIHLNKWNEEHWKEFESVKNGNKPSLMIKQMSGRKKDQFQAIKEDEIYIGGRKDLAKIFECHHNTISVNAEIGRDFNGFKITKL